jgi:transposase
MPEMTPRWSGRIRAHRELILNYFRARKEFSSDVLEGLNNKAKVTMRRPTDSEPSESPNWPSLILGKLPEPELTHRFF